MRAHAAMGALALAMVAGCGLENMLGNVGKGAHERPASAIRGTLGWPGAQGADVAVLNADGQPMIDELFRRESSGASYEVRLESSRYEMLRVQARAGDMALRTIVPSVGEESSVVADVDARNATETLITEARLSARRAQGESFAKMTPAAYVGNGVDSGARTLIRAAFDVSGVTQDLLRMVERIMARADLGSGATDPAFFRVPELDAAYVVTTSPLDSGWLARTRFDYDGDGITDLDGSKFDAALAAAAQLYEPMGCLDPAHIRLVFTVDFADGNLDGTCNPVNRFKWLSPKTIQPGQAMFFVGWIYTTTSIPVSEVTDPAVNNLLGAGVPNTIRMYDDGTNGDEAAGDGIWTIAFDVPFDPARKLRIGYKYTWGTRGRNWTGTEEWPGNSRILEVVDENADGFVYRRDVFGDEATNKDRANLNPASGGTISWDTALHGCGPESHEQMFTLHNACACGSTWFTPQAIGPIRVACTQ